VTLIPAELSLLTLRQFCVFRVDGRRTCIVFEMTDEDPNLIHGQNGNNPLLRPHVNSCHGDDWM